MKRMTRFGLFLCILPLIWLFAACERTGEDEYVEKSFTLPAFDTLRIAGPVNVYLSMDTANSMIVSGSPVIVDNVKYTIDNGTLTLESTYQYKMFKPASNKAGIFLNLASISRIDIAESCGLKSVGIIRTGELGLVVMAKYADVDLEVDCASFYYWDYSLSGGMVRLAGETGTLRIWNFSLMTVDAGGLTSDKAIIENTARSPCYIRAIKELKYSIFGQGDIYYFGKPDSIKRGEVTSSGRLIQAD